MLHFEGATRVASERWLAFFDHEPGGSRIVHDAECVEYEWGWRIEWGPNRPAESEILVVFLLKTRGRSRDQRHGEPHFGIPNLKEVNTDRFAGIDLREWH